MAYQTHAETYQSLGVLAEIQKPTCAEDAYASLLQWCKIFICFGFGFHFNLIDVSHKMTSGCFLQQWFSYDTLGFAWQDDYPELCCLSTYLFVVSL